MRAKSSVRKFFFLFHHKWHIWSQSTARKKRGGKGSIYMKLFSREMNWYSNKLELKLFFQEKQITKVICPFFEKCWKRFTINYLGNTFFYYSIKRHKRNDDLITFWRNVYKTNRDSACTSSSFNRFNCSIFYITKNKLSNYDLLY